MGAVMKKGFGVVAPAVCSDIQYSVVWLFFVRVHVPGISFVLFFFSPNLDSRILHRIGKKKTATYTCSPRLRIEYVQLCVSIYKPFGTPLTP